jgi:hypothetical protein
MRMRHIVFGGLPGSAIFSTLSYKLHGFRKRKAFDIQWCFDFLCKRLSEILRRIERDMIKKTYIGLHVKFPFFLSDFDGT